MQKVKVNGHSVQRLETDRRAPAIVLPPILTRSVMNVPIKINGAANMMTIAKM